MYKKFLLVITSFALLTILFAACTIRDESSISSGPQVKMGASNFIDTTITIKKGESITLVDTATAPHIITNGTWDGTTQKPAKEAGAPTVNLNFSGGDSKSAGPFTTAGTFKLYCTIHQGMNLTVTVQ
ncbi:MAG TPA: plastocyanin/azurin family copper-binding protein [Ktedonosporobacter sp.]|jgi:plastocyanin|nr:plastocyanin/azurin family copper-binding protein [Ktedonosporobacter sp.]